MLVIPEMPILTIEGLPDGTKRVDSPPQENLVAKDLDPYRQLVELQKQMIELARQNEQGKQKRDALHEQMMRETGDRRHDRRGLRHRVQRSAAGLLKRVSGFAWRKPVPARSTANRQVKKRAVLNGA